MKAEKLTALLLTALITVGCAAPAETVTEQDNTAQSVTSAENTEKTTSTESGIAADTAAATEKATETTAATTAEKATETNVEASATATEKTAETTTAESAVTTTAATASATTEETTVTTDEITDSLDEKLTERTRIQIARDDILFDFIRASGNDSNEKNAAKYVNDSAEYTLEIPRALAEFLQPDDKIIINAEVNREKINGEYVRYLALSGLYTDYLCARDENDNGAIDEQETDDAIYSRTNLLNRFLVIRNDKLMLDDTFAALGLTLDDFSYEKENYNMLSAVYINSQENSLYYGLYGGYNKYDKANGKYEYYDGMPLTELIELMERVSAEKQQAIKDADNSGADTEWNEWVVFAAERCNPWIVATVK